ncbi:endodeoxyribonuclease [Phlyctochytrium planicorne]|nr:endodeoxyribonuclease [Phlyctochytrium planicorne]
MGDILMRMEGVEDGGDGSPQSQEIFEESLWDDLEDDMDQGRAMVRNIGGEALELQLEVSQNPVAKKSSKKQVIEIAAHEHQEGADVNVLERLESCLEQMNAAIENGMTPVFKIRKRKRLAAGAEGDDDEDSQPSQVSQEEPARKKRKQQEFVIMRHGTKRHRAMLKAIELVVELLQENRTATKRDLFYRFVDMFGKQEIVDKAIEDIACSLRVPRHFLNVVAASKGLASGPISFIMRNGTILDCSNSNRGVLIPSPNEYKDILFHNWLSSTPCYFICTAKYALIVEKEASFFSLLDAGFDPTYVILTGKGYPDVNTRALVKLLAEMKRRDRQDHWYLEVVDPRAVRNEDAAPEVPNMPHEEQPPAEHEHIFIDGLVFQHDERSPSPFPVPMEEQQPKAVVAKEPSNAIPEVEADIADVPEIVQRPDHVREVASVPVKVLEEVWEEDILTFSDEIEFRRGPSEEILEEEDAELETERDAEMERVEPRDVPILGEQDQEDGAFRIFGLMDGDPHGISILCCYRYGSQAMAFDDKNLACPSLRWIGIHPSDPDSACLGQNTYRSTTMVLSDRERRMVLGMLGRDEIRKVKQLRRELCHLIHANHKREIQDVSIKTLVESYNKTKMSRPLEQIVMGTTFTGMGLVTMLFPNTVAKLCFNPSFLGQQSTPAKPTTVMSPPLKLTFQCFGAQATLCGTLILVSRFEKETYLYFGAAILPFFVFDYIAWKAKAVSTIGALGDFAGNVVFVVCCYIGFSRS